MSSIFISYRRSDAEGEAGRLADDLIRRFGDTSVFMDVDAIQPGRDFRKAIDESIRTCSILLAVVGPEWSGAKNGQGEPRLWEPNDYVRMEIASALRRDIPVVPVLVRSAKMPEVEQLPEELVDFVYRNSVELTHARWRTDLQLLIHALEPYLQACEDVPKAEVRANEGVVEAAPENRVALNAAKSALTARPSLTPVQMEAVAGQLAPYIGPIALLVVKRAAKHCGTVAELAQTVAVEIESGDDRAKFVASCQRLA